MPAPRTLPEYSRAVVEFLEGGNAAYWAALSLSAAALLGPILLLVTDFFTLFEARSLTAEIPGSQVSGLRNHGPAMLLIGLLAAPMAYGAIRGGSRPAMIALAALGAVAGLIAVVIDLPDATGSSTLSSSFAFASAETTPRLGFFLETLGAALLLIAGGGGLVLHGGDDAEESEAPPTGKPDTARRRPPVSPAPAAAGSERPASGASAAPNLGGRPPQRAPAHPSSDRPDPRPARRRSGGLMRAIGDQISGRRGRRR